MKLAGGWKERSSDALDGRVVEELSQISVNWNTRVYSPLSVFFFMPQVYSVFLVCWKQTE